MNDNGKILTLADLYSFLELYKSFDDQEENERLAFLQFIKTFGDFSYIRDNLVGHLTVSAWIVNSGHDKTLMAFHNLYKFWAWLGGHTDGQPDLLKVILKEIREESSLHDLCLLAPLPMDLSILSVESHYKHGVFVPRHLHYNLTYCFEADENQFIQAKPDENSGVNWIGLKDIEKYCRSDQAYPYYQRIMKKMQKIS